LRRDKHCLQMNWNELPLDPRHLGVPSGVPETFFACSVPTMHLYCIEINTISKCTATNFYLTHAT
jgi:hypothetical protein